MIDIRNINKSFGSLQVLTDISFQIKTGEIVAIVGPSGAGKTTLLQIIGSLDKPDSGNIKYDNTDITTLNDKKISSFRNSHIGFIFQFHQLLPEFSALENIIIPALINGTPRKKAIDKANELLKKLDIINRADHKPAELSGGEKQRVAIARALINNPDVIFADEPTGSLDSQNRNEIQNLICKLREEFNQTFVIVTHDRHLANIADKIISMSDGKIVNIEYSNQNPI